MKHLRVLTGCTKPCKYKKYTFIGEKHSSSFKSDYFAFSLWATSNDAFSDTEVYSIHQNWNMDMMKSKSLLYFFQVLMYPLFSLLSDICGSLGLFLGFSLMSIWDWIKAVYICLAPVVTSSSDKVNWKNEGELGYNSFLEIFIGVTCFCQKNIFQVTFVL